jgi:peptide deformylase
MKIITYPNPILEKKAKKIADPLDPKIQKLIKNMLDTMEKADGAGLASPQVGKSLCLSTIKYGGEIFVLINPKITSYSREKSINEEGCLSFPGKFIPVKRSEKVKLRYTNEKGNKLKIKADGLLARIIQHEVDHLDGILFINRKK